MEYCKSIKLSHQNEMKQPRPKRTDHAVQAASAPHTQKPPNPRRWAVANTHLVDGGSQLRRGHADHDSCALKGSNLLLSSPFSSSNNGPCVTHSSPRRSS